MSKIRIDMLIAERENITRSAAQHLLENGNVLLNGKPAKKSDKADETDEISVTMPPPKEYSAVAQNIPLDIVYEDNDLIVVNKQKGMVVHPAPGNEDGTLVNALLFHCQDNLSSGMTSLEDEYDSMSVGGYLRPGIVHRIDKDTSGLLVVAKNDDAHNFLSSQLKEHKMGRYYEAIVLGIPKETEYQISKPIGRHPPNRKKMAVVTGGREAVTNVKVLKAYYTPYGNFAYVRLQLLTGRTHQIRVHMSYTNHPCLGDIVYGGSENKFAKMNAEILSGQCLHAKTLEIEHPVTHKLLNFDSELPDYFKQVLEKLEKLS